MLRDARGGLTAERHRGSPCALHRRMRDSIALLSCEPVAIATSIDRKLARRASTDAHVESLRERTALTRPTGAVSARRTAPPRVLDHPLTTPGTRPSRLGRGGCHSAHLAESDVWSPGATHRARTHPERIPSVGAYRRLALERELRACGGFCCFSGLSSVNFGREAKSEGSSSGI